VLILASTSRYRRELLARLGVPFECVAPDIAETPHAGEPVADLVIRLAREKALAVLARHPGALVIGSDQLAQAPDGAVLGKPGSVDGAIAQLRRCSAGTVRFFTAVALADGRDGRVRDALVTTDVVFRALDDATIARYVALEQPLDCAGSFKCEGLGIALFERLASDDPTALIGLPLIATARLLRETGCDPLTVR
jgi:septum formation protein